MSSSKPVPLPSSTWPSSSLPAPPLEHVLTQIQDFFVKLGYVKTIKALVKEAENHNVVVGGQPLSSQLGPLKQTLGDLYVDAFLGWEEGAAAIGLSDEEIDQSSDDNSDSSDDESESEGDDDSDDAMEVTDSEEDVAKLIANPQLKRKRDVSASASSSEDDSNSSDESGSEDVSELGSESDSEESAAPPQKKTKLEAKVTADFEDSSDDSSEDSSADDEDSEEESDSEADSDDETGSDAEEIASAPTSGTSASDDSSDSEDDDDDSESSFVSSSDEDEDEDVDTPIVKRKSATDDSHASTTSSSSSATLVGESSNDNIHPARAGLMNPQTTVATTKEGKKQNVPFSRIPSNTYVDPRFSSNAYVSYDYADRAHQDLIVTKGKGFTKEKNKKKRGSYRGGIIDTTPKSIKFDD